MGSITFQSNSETETLETAQRIAKLFKKGDIIYLEGKLGSGKTVFVKGLVKGLGMNFTVRSPSFLIVKRYSHLYHLDFYRLSPREAADFYNEYVLMTKMDGIYVIEWASRIKKLVDKMHLTVVFSFSRKGPNIRNLRFITENQKKFIRIKRCLY